ncbi:D-inositol-3-phosphate glycosyltransferase [compost metagenome]
MKILRIIPSIDLRAGGPIAGAHSIDSELIRNGHTVEVLCLDDEDTIDQIIDKYPAKVHTLAGSKGKFRYNSHLLRWIEKHAPNFDAVIINGLWQYHSFASWRALSGSRTPYFVFTHGMLDPWFKKNYPLKHLKKWLYWPWAEYRVLRDAKAVIFTCEEERLLARQSFWLYRANEAVTAYGSSSPPGDGDALAQRFLATHPALHNKRIILFLGRIHEKKGCDLLLQAFAQVAEQDERLHLLIAGPDQAGWTASLKTQAERLGIAQRISWPGMLQGDVKWGAYYAAEIFCLPSHQENFGIVVAEALACGKPVLISNKVNIWREIESDSAGFVDDDSIEGTTNNLQRWLALDRENYAQMAQRAKQCFAQRFHIQRAAERLIEIIQEHT